MPSPCIIYSSHIHPTLHLPFCVYMCFDLFLSFFFPRIFLVFNWNLSLSDAPASDIPQCNHRTFTRIPCPSTIFDQHSFLTIFLLFSFFLPTTSLQVICLLLTRSQTKAFRLYPEGQSLNPLILDIHVCKNHDPVFIFPFDPPSFASFFFTILIFNST